jgi:hypothetical protein
MMKMINSAKISNKVKIKVNIRSRHKSFENIYKFKYLGTTLTKIRLIMEL